MTTEKERKQTTVRMDAKMLEDVRGRAKAKGRTMGEEIEQLIAEGLKQEKRRESIKKQLGKQ